MIPPDGLDIDESEEPPPLNAGRLWAGGVATAVVAALAVVILVAAPFSQPAPLASKVFTAIINLVAGVAVISLLSGVARTAVRPRSRQPSARPDMRVK
jgi:hypothetical protein